MIKQSFQAKKRPQKVANQFQNTTSLGKFGEKIALIYLQNKGYKLLARNFCIRGGELDIIMEKNDIITFVEVKLRTGKNFGDGGEAITFSKKQKLLRTIFVFLGNEKSSSRNHSRTKRIDGRNWRLDLISIRFNPSARTARIQHFQNILEA